MEETLQQIGLSPEETEIYLTLLNKGTQSAAEIGNSTKVKRTYVYKVVEGLIDKGMVTQGKKGRTTVFSPNSPDHLLTLSNKKKQQAEQAQLQLESYLDDLKSKYASVEEKPIVTQYEGIIGLKAIYKDINKEKQDILLIRSFYDDKRSDIDELINKQIEEQVRNNIHARVVGPVEKNHPELVLKIDKERLVEERLLPSEFVVPSQIIIYSTKVAIISLKKGIVATLIDNEDINRTFRELFEYIWKASEKYHNKLVAEWASGQKVDSKPKA